MRPSPSMLVALLALFVALTGTATAAIVITSPDQLGDRVVTEPKLDRNAVNSRALAADAVGVGELRDRAVGLDEQRRPILSARVDFAGRVVAGVGVDTARSRYLTLGDGSVGYELAFDRNIRECSVTVTQDGGAAQGLPVRPRIMTAGRRFATDDVVFIEAFDPATQERIKSRVDGFSVLAQC